MFTFCKISLRANNTFKNVRVFNRCFQSSAFSLDKFSDAQSKLKTLSEDPGPMVKLQLYGLFKQATKGVCKDKKPGMLDMVGGAKWKSWTVLGDMSCDDAKEKYASLVDELVSKDASSAPTSSSSASTTSNGGGGVGAVDGIQTGRRGKAYTITLDRPDKMNALTMEMYQAIIDALAESAKDDSLFTVLKANGNYYCSGNDLSTFKNLSPDQFQETADKGGLLFRNYIDAYISHPKPIIAMVQGPAVGVAVTVLGLCDLVYASDKATFWTPFTQIGQSIEGCSSYTFPRIMGPAKANEMLLFNERITAQQANDCGLVTRVYPSDVFEEEVWSKLDRFSESAMPKSLKICKNLLRENDREHLHKLNKLESETLAKTWLGEECMQAVMKFFSK